MFATLFTDESARECTFCNVLISNGHLKRHIVGKHRDEAQVKRAVQLPLKEQHNAFNNMRKEGIMSFNRNVLSSSEAGGVLQREYGSGTEADTILCTTCEAFFSKKACYKHRASCTPEPSNKATAPSISKPLHPSIITIKKQWNTLISSSNAISRRGTGRLQEKPCRRSLPKRRPY